MTHEFTVHPLFAQARMGIALGSMGEGALPDAFCESGVDVSTPIAQDAPARAMITDAASHEAAHPATSVRLYSACEMMHGSGQCVQQLFQTEQPRLIISQQATLTLGVLMATTAKEPEKQNNLAFYAFKGLIGAAFVAILDDVM